MDRGRTRNGLRNCSGVAQVMQSAHSVTLVIPARDAEATIEQCLRSVIAIKAQDDSSLMSIILVDDGSCDETTDIARRLDVIVMTGTGRGAAAARNIGWRAASTDLVWFIDADCVADVNALNTLLPHLVDTTVAAAGGTYDISSDASLLQRLIHEEIKVRHAKMPVGVDFLATFDVLYRRSVLESLHGFDERYLKGQDAELAFRVIEAGHNLHFEQRSIVLHHHADSIWRYLRVQQQQGYWRVALHLEHRGRERTNSYSNVIDHAQPFVATLIPIAALLSVVLIRWWLVMIPITALLLLQLPMAVAMARRAGLAMLTFVVLGTVRAGYRATGMWAGVIDRVLSHPTALEKKP